MSKAEVPCVLDPMRNCPNSCKLQEIAENIIEKLARKHGKSREEEIEVFRSGTADTVRLFRMVYSRMLQDAGKSSDCKHYPEADIGIQRQDQAVY